MTIDLTVTGEVDITTYQYIKMPLNELQNHIDFGILSYTNSVSVQLRVIKLSFFDDGYINPFPSVAKIRFVRSYQNVQHVLHRYNFSFLFYLQSVSMANEQYIKGTSSNKQACSSGAHLVLSP